MVTRLVATLLLLALPAAAAEDDLDPARSGFYFGVGAVYAIENFSFDSENLGMVGILGPGVDPDYDDSDAGATKAACTVLDHPDAPRTRRSTAPHR